MRRLACPEPRRAAAFLPFPFRSYVVLTRLPSTSTCEPFLIVVATYSDSRGRNTQTRCHSVFEAHSSSVLFNDLCVATAHPKVRDSSGELPAVVVPRLTLLRVCSDEADDRH